MPDLMVTPGGYIDKPGKKPHLKSFQVMMDSMPYNMIANKSNKPDIILATSKLHHWTQIYNLCILYPQWEILIFNDDVSSAFCISKDNLEVVKGKAYVLKSISALSVGQTFGDCSSPANFEPITRAQTALAEHYSATNTPVPDFPEYLEKVQFCPEPDATITFAPAVADKFNPGVLDSTGKQKLTKFSMHVNNSQYTEVGHL